MSLRRVLMWSALAATGLVLAVAVTTLATEITSQDIGLQSEPLTAGDDLAPRSAATETPPAPSPTEPAPSPSGSGESEEGEEGDDDSGRGRGRSRGRGSDDDGDFDDD